MQSDPEASTNNELSPLSFDGEHAKEIFIHGFLPVQ